MRMQFVKKINAIAKTMGAFAHGIEKVPSEQRGGVESDVVDSERECHQQSRQNNISETNESEVTCSFGKPQGNKNFDRNIQLSCDGYHHVGAENSVEFR
jgi:hypothetical protein